MTSKTPQTWKVDERITYTRTVYVTASSKSEALAAARDGKAHDWEPLPDDADKVTYSNPRASWVKP